MMLRIKPLITEKSANMIDVGQYSFIVDKNVNKNSVKEIVEKQFNVIVEKAQSLNYIGKVTNFKRHPGKKKRFKKIILKLKKGQTIKEFQIDSSKDKIDSKEHNTKKA